MDSNPPEAPDGDSRRGVRRDLLILWETFASWFGDAGVRSVLASLPADATPFTFARGLAHRFRPTSTSQRDRRSLPVGELDPAVYHEAGRAVLHAGEIFAAREEALFCAEKGRESLIWEVAQMHVIRHGPLNKLLSQFLDGFRH